MLQHARTHMQVCNTAVASPPFLLSIVLSPGQLGASCPCFKCLVSPPHTAHAACHYLFCRPHLCPTNASSSAEPLCSCAVSTCFLVILHLTIRMMTTTVHTNISSTSVDGITALKMMMVVGTGRPVWLSSWY